MRQQLSYQLLPQIMLRTAMMRQPTMRHALSLASLHSQLQFQSLQLPKLLLLIKVPIALVRDIYLCKYRRG
jgi:hypothetical protein